MSFKTLSFTLTVAVLWTLAATTATFAESMDSAGFDYKYEANSGLPTVEDNGAGKTNWAFFNHAAVNAGFAVSDGVLSYSTMSTLLGGDWFYSNAAVSGSAWNAEVGANTSFSIEFSAKITDGAGAVPGLHVIFDTGANRCWLNVDTDHVGIGSGNSESAVLSSGLDNYSDYHLYRIAYDADAVHFQVWRDGVKIGSDVTPFATTAKYLAFGDATSTGSGAGTIDYFRWDADGAYEPVPEPGMLTLLGLGALGLFVLRKK